MGKYIKLISMLIIIILLIIMTGVPKDGDVMAGSCYGSSCQGLDPNATGCDHFAGTHLENQMGSVYVETRKSQGCNVKWTRVTNISGNYQYIAATVRHSTGSYSVSSPGLVENSHKIYTRMVGIMLGSVRSCGKGGQSPIPVPIAEDNYCLDG